MFNNKPGSGKSGQGDDKSRGQKKGNEPSRYQQQLKSKQQGQASVRLKLEQRSLHGRDNSDRIRRRIEGDDIDLIFGFERISNDKPNRLGWLLNFLPISMLDENGVEKSGLDLYFLDKDNNNFKGTVFYDPYFYVDVIDERFLSETAQHIQKRFEGCRVEQLEKEDLDMPGHLSGKKHRFLKLSFNTVQELIDAKSELRFIIYIILFYILYL